MEWLKLSVILLIVSVIQCWGMSNDELEDFMNFLKKTSQLDQTIRKGVDPDDDFDEDEQVSDHAWEESGKFEGDLILNDRQRRLIVQDVAEGLSRNGLKDSTKRWPNNEVIYYIQKEHFSSDQVQAIQSGIDDLAQASCIRFRPYKKGDRDAVVIQGSRRGCFSQVGYQSGYQVLNLSGRHPVGRGCFRHGTVVHELLHTLGFYHMQSSPDRDDYIDVVWENIIKPARHNFRKYNSFAVSDFGVGYDYDSVLHYSRRAFSSNGQDTLVPKKGGADIGQRIGLSDKDTQKLNKMYCDADSNDNQADDDSSSKPMDKKKKPKNKPFDGHGIGYHQGKTVVIKLLPAPETYKLPDVPTFHVFDYFSKAPQALSTSESEGYRFGKEMIYPQLQPALIKTTETTNINTKDKPYDVLSYDDKIGVTNLEVNDTPKHIKKFTVENEKPSISSEEQDVDLTNAFDSLAKIIKSHVYPSHMPDLRIYKLKNNYDKLYDTQKYSENKDTLAPNETDDDISESSVEPIGNQYDLAAVRATQEKEFNRGHKITEKYDQEQKHNVNTERHGETELTSPGQRKHNYFELGSSYGTSSFPKAHQYRDHSDSVSRSYIVPNIQHKNDYSSLHHPKVEDHSKTISYHLFGDEVPLNEDWNEKDIHKHNPAVYDTDSYTDSLTNVKSKSYVRDKLPTRNPYHSNNRGEVFNTMPPQTNQKYSLFGFEVPLNKEWYKIDYTKENYDSTKKETASNEDNR